jgi:glycosyltransferase involved in cell wall biosynthesis
VTDVKQKFPFAPLPPASGFEGGISVFFPAFNDAPSLPALLSAAIGVLRRHVSDYEVIVVNDGSTDSTAEVLEQLQREYHPHVRVITHRRNLGYGAALRSGLAAATKEFIFYTDGDGQYDPAELPRLLAAMTPETGLVNGYKTERNDPWHRVLIGKLYNRFARWLFRIRLRDIDCDFRLIRRSALDLSHLRSTGGTICIEIVRSLELSGAQIAEVPVRHYPRQHGRSQFFRFRSLAGTLLQLGILFFRQVAVPAVRAGPRWVTAALMLLGLGALSLMTYARTLNLPFISDDYAQIELGRRYGPVSQWGDLMEDALYRCRATSILLTYWTERLFGLSPFAFNISSLLLHVANSFLVFALGLWRIVGWKISAIAAAFFAVSQRHSEAVVWYAALPELLVFLFALASFLCWTRWLQASQRSHASYAAAFGFFLLALLSKESAVAVAGLCALAVFCEPRQTWKRLLGTAPFFLTGGAYFALAYAARQDHLHFNDGTFSLSAPFWSVMLRSAGRLLWDWGFLGLVMLAAWRPRERRALLGISAAWMGIGLLPYSFLTYMPQVPSRHTYLASVALSFIVAVWLLSLRDWTASRNRGWIAPVAAAVIALQQAAYVSMVKYDQYFLRAKPTEDLVRAAQPSGGPIYARCFPYPAHVGVAALRLHGKDVDLVTGQDAQTRPDALDFCEEVPYE